VSTYEEAASAICDRGDHLNIVSAMFPCQPDPLLEAVIGKAAGKAISINLFVADIPGRFDFLPQKQKPEKVSITTIAGRVPRWLSPSADCLPVSLGEAARRFTDASTRADVLVLYAGDVSAGHLPFGPVVGYTPAALQAGTFVVAEVNSGISPVDGHPDLPLERVDLLLRAGQSELKEMPGGAPSPVEQAIGRHVALLIRDGATIEMGIGRVSESFLLNLRGKRDLGIHTGGLPETAMDLIQSGIVTGKAKCRDTGLHVATSLIGTRRLYEFAADPRNHVSLRPVTETHSLRCLLEFDNLVAVNSAIEVDLTGNVNAEFLYGQRFASPGGQPDFATAAHSCGRGANIVALPARSGDASRIVKTLPAGTTPTTRANEVDLVVTEYGVADLRGRTATERAEATIAIAHPDDRKALSRGF
jgi:acyl-CoA hydrolase